MAERLSGKTALVTGAAVRVGRTTALALARQGVNVVVHYGRSSDDAERTAEEIRALGVKAWTASADLADEEDAGRLVPKVVAAAGPLDYLVNNASIFEPSRVTDFRSEDLCRNVSVNAMAPLVLSRAFAAQGRPGAIVNILDTAMVRYDASHAAYHLSKRMLYSITRMTAAEFAPLVRVNGVAPGLILPAGADQAYLEKLARNVPLKRTGSPEAVADAVLFLLASDYVTGQVIFVDGGHHLKGRMYE